jgi:hypothetical protein
MITEAYNNFEAAGITIQDKAYNGVVFGEHPAGYTTLDIYVKGKLVKWFYLSNWEEALEEYKNIF